MSPCDGAFHPREAPPVGGIGDCLRQNVVAGGVTGEHGRPSPPLEVGSLKSSYGVWVSVVSSPSGVWGGAPADKRF